MLGATWGSVSCPRILWHADWSSQPPTFSIATRQPFTPRADLNSLINRIKYFKVLKITLSIENYLINAGELHSESQVVLTNATEQNKNLKTKQNICALFMQKDSGFSQSLDLQCVGCKSQTLDCVSDIQCKITYLQRDLRCSEIQFQRVKTTDSKLTEHTLLKVILLYFVSPLVSACTLEQKVAQENHQHH